MDELISLSKSILAQLNDQAGGPYDGPARWMKDYANSLRRAIEKAERERSAISKK